MKKHLLPARSHHALREPLLLVTGTMLAFAVGAQSTPADSAPKKATEAKDAVVMQPVTVTGTREDGYTVKESSFATKLNLSPRETPQSMTVITRQRLEDQNLTDLRQVLDNTPGVYSNAYDSERVLFYARGFLIDTLLYDGVPALSNFNTGSIDETLETAFYERIEVVRGATGLMSGAGNPAASINLVRKHADSRTTAISLDLSAGSWNKKRAELDASTPLSADGRIRGRILAVGEDRDSYQALYRKRTYALYGVVDADLTPATRVSVGFDYQDNRPRSNTWGSFPLFLADGSTANWSRSVTTATDWTYWNRKTQTLFGELRHNFENGWTLRSSLSHRRYDEDLRLFYVDGFPDPTTGLGLEPYVYASKGTVTENALDLYASGPFALLGRQHELVLGYNGSRARNVGTAYATIGTLPPTGNFFQWDGSYPEPQFAEGTPLNDITTQQDAVYAAARFSLADKLKLIAGARYARWKVDSFYVYDTPNDSKYDFTKVIPYAGLIWDFHPQFSAFASYTGIFKPQNNRDIGGRYLDPITGRSFELGIKGEHFDRRLNTSFTVFETRQSNIAAPVLDPITGDPVLLPDGTAVSQGIDGTKTRGFEAEMAGRLTNDVQASLGWTRYLTKDATGQTIRTFIPPSLVRLFATWEPKQIVNHLTLGAGVNWQSESSTAIGSPTGAVQLQQGAVTQVSLMARYQFSPNLALQFNGNNLLDKMYYVLDQYGNTYYGSPANYSVSLRLSY